MEESKEIKKNYKLDAETGLITSDEIMQVAQEQYIVTLQLPSEEKPEPSDK